MVAVATDFVAIATPWVAESKGGDAQYAECGATNRPESNLLRSLLDKGASDRIAQFRCQKKECRKNFSAPTGTVIESSKLEYQTWVFAIYIVMTSLKGVSSMKLHRDLGIGRKAAWFLPHRLREATAVVNFQFAGPVESDETYVGAKEANKHQHKRMKAAEVLVGKAIVTGVKDRATNKVAARIVSDTKSMTLTDMVADCAEIGAGVFTDEARGYLPLKKQGNGRKAVRHSTGPYEDGMAHTNDIGSFWAMLKRGYHGTYQQISTEHLDRYVAEFSHRHNARPLDAFDQMGKLVRGMDQRRLTYAELIADGVHARRRMEMAAWQTQ